LDVVIAVVGALVLAVAVEIQRASFRSSYLEMTELLRGLGDSPSPIAVVIRVLLMPAAIAFLAAFARPSNPLATGFAIGIVGNGLVVWRGLFDPPSLARDNLTAYRLLILGFLALTGVCGLAGGWLASALFCSSAGACRFADALLSIGGTLALGVIATVLAQPLVRYLYRKS
jgi:hypothetical protein